MRTKLVAILVCLAAFAVAQEKEKPGESRHHYKLEVSLSEFEGNNKTNERHYTLLCTEGERTTLRTGNRVPIATGSFGGSGKVDPTVVNTQYQYIDTGFNMDIRIREDAAGLQMQTSSELSSVVPAESSTEVSRITPVIRSLRQDVNALVKIGKPTVLTSIDDVNTKRRYQLEVTATRAD